MRHLLASLALAAVATAPAFAAAPLLEARFTAAPEGVVAVRGAAFICKGDTCAARSAASRPMVLCQRLVREAGPVDRFRVDGVPMSDADLAACNAKAR